MKFLVLSLRLEKQRKISAYIYGNINHNAAQ